MPLIRRMRILMGTAVVIEAVGDAGCLEQAFGEIARIEALLHPTRPGSDVARINAARAGETLEIAADTHRLLALSLALHRLSGGTFDPCLPERPGRVVDLELRSDGLRCREPVALDLGGIAKGHAVDCAVSALRRGGCRAALVNAGGDLRVLGEPLEPILIRSAGGELAPVRLVDEALAVSELDVAARPGEHRGYYLREGAVRPDSGASRPRTAAAVIAPEAVLADALTKCVLLGSPANAARALGAFGARAL